MTWREAAKALAADDMWVRGSMEQKLAAGPGLSGSAGGGCRKKMRCFCVATSLCYDVRRQRSFPQAFEPSELYHGKRSQVQLVFGVFLPKTPFWDLSVLTPANVLGRVPFPCHLPAACGYWQCMLP